MADGLESLGPALSAYVAAADQLEVLELSMTWDFTSRHHTIRPQVPLAKLLPSKTFLRLHTLVLDGFYVTENEITSFLLLQSRCLQDLTLWNVALLSGGLWKRVFAMLSKTEAFRLESLVMKGLDDDQVFQHAEAAEVPARINNDIALEYINEGGVTLLSEENGERNREASRTMIGRCRMPPISLIPRSRIQTTLPIKAMRKLTKTSIGLSTILNMTSMLKQSRIRQAIAKLATVRKVAYEIASQKKPPTDLTAWSPLHHRSMQSLPLMCRLQYLITPRTVLWR